MGIKIDDFSSFLHLSPSLFSHAKDESKRERASFFFCLSILRASECVDESKREKREGAF